MGGVNGDEGMTLNFQQRQQTGGFRFIGGAHSVFENFSISWQHLKIKDDVKPKFLASLEKLEDLTKLVFTTALFP